MSMVISISLRTRSFDGSLVLASGRTEDAGVARKGIEDIYKIADDRSAQNQLNAERREALKQNWPSVVTTIRDALERVAKEFNDGYEGPKIVSSSGPSGTWIGFACPSKPRLKWKLKMDKPAQSATVEYHIKGADDKIAPSVTYYIRPGDVAAIEIHTDAELDSVIQTDDFALEALRPLLLDVAVTTSSSSA